MVLTKLSSEMISVEILPATYNGNTYLHSLIDSLYRVEIIEVEFGN